MMVPEKAEGVSTEQQSKNEIEQVHESKTEDKVKETRSLSLLFLRNCLQQQQLSKILRLKKLINVLLIP